MTRDLRLDLLRGIAIADMIMVHFAFAFSSIPRKIIIYNDIAIELFLFVSGYTIGKFAYQRYLENSIQGIVKIVRGLGKVIAIYCFQVITIIPLLYYLAPNSLFLHIQGDVPLHKLIFELLILKRQIGIIHILPTFFIPYIISMVIIRYIEKKSILIFIMSFSLYSIGLYEPYIFNYGDKTIFPFILWQIYFFIGLLFGKNDILKIISKHKRTFQIVLTILIFIAILLKYGKHIYDYGGLLLIVKKFPLNFAGTVYGFSLLFSIAIIIYSIEEKYYKNIIAKIIRIFGRNSLAVFNLHTFQAYFIIIILEKIKLKNMQMQLIILLSTTLIYFMVIIYEKTKQKKWKESEKK